MTRAARAIAASLIAAASLASPAALLAQGRPADVPGKEAADSALARCRTTSECLTIGRRYQSLGLAQDSRRAVDRAATLAKDASEWHSVSSSYQVLGYAQLADEALQKAQRAPIR